MAEKSLIDYLREVLAAGYSDENFGIWVNPVDLNDYRLGQTCFENGGVMDGKVFVGNLGQLSYVDYGFIDAIEQVCGSGELKYDGRLVRINPKGISDAYACGKLDKEFASFLEKKAQPVWDTWVEEEARLKFEGIEERFAPGGEWEEKCLNALEALKDFHDGDLSGLSFVANRLPGADLQGLDLRQTKFQFAVLQFAVLCDANLQNANLEGANLEGANLKEANLREADLCRADLRYANLEKAALIDANLEGANLEGANLEGSDLDGANLEGANLDGANLNGTCFMPPEELTALVRQQAREGDPAAKAIVVATAALEEGGDKVNWEGYVGRLRGESYTVQRDNRNGCVTVYDLEGDPLIITDPRGMVRAGGSDAAQQAVADLAGRYDQAKALQVAQVAQARCDEGR